VSENGIKEMFDEMYNKETQSYSVFTDVYGVHLGDKRKVYRVYLVDHYDRLEGWGDLALSYFYILLYT
jgi:hypothetical protein